MGGASFLGGGGVVVNENSGKVCFVCEGYDGGKVGFMRLLFVDFVVSLSLSLPPVC